MKSLTQSEVSRITLEQPASIRRQLPSLDEQGWVVPDYHLGPENAPAGLLFAEPRLAELWEQSPIVFYGEKGVGKTALAITLAVNWSRASNRRPLCFATGKSFASEYASAVEIDDLESFRKRFRQCKLLVIDDIDILGEKPAAQQELALTLDHLSETQAPVILSAHKLPSSIASIQPFLSSRLAGGLSICLQKPSNSTQAAILQRLSETVGTELELSPLIAFCNTLAVPPSAGDLKTIFTIALQNCHDGDFDLDVVSQLSRQILAGDTLTVSGIAKSVAKKMRVKLSDMRGSTRQANIVRARGLAILLVRRLTPYSLQQIGEFFGGRDHSTILHAYRKTEALVQSDAELSKVLVDVRTELLK